MQAVEVMGYTDAFYEGAAYPDKAFTDRFIEAAEARRVAAEEAAQALTELGESRREMGRAIMLESTGPAKPKRERVACECGLFVTPGPAMTTHERGGFHRRWKARAGL